VIVGRSVAMARDSNPLGNLPSKATRMWEHVYESAQERGLDKGAAAAQAWCAVKRRYYKKNGRWLRRKAPLGPDQQPPGCTPSSLVNTGTKPMSTNSNPTSWQKAMRRGEVKTKKTWKLVWLEEPRPDTYRFEIERGGNEGLLTGTVYPDGTVGSGVNRLTPELKERVVKTVEKFVRSSSQRGRIQNPPMDAVKADIAKRTLNSMLTDYDRRIQSRSPNIYRLSHLLKASDNVFEGIDDSSSVPVSLLEKRVQRFFIVSDMPPARNFISLLRTQTQEDPGGLYLQGWPKTRGKKKNPGESLQEIRKAFNDIGFWIVKTGGGCTALRFDIPGTDPEQFLLITDDDCHAPESWDHEVLIGLHDEESADSGDSIGDVESYDSTRELLELLKSGSGKGHSSWPGRKTRKTNASIKSRLLKP